VNNQTEAICLKAVENCGDALMYVNNQTEDICLKAVEEDGYALQHVKNQTIDICLKAVKNDHAAIRYVDKTIFEDSLKTTTKEPIYCYEYEKMESPIRGIFKTTYHYTDEEAKHLGLTGKGWRKIISSKKIWEK
jgi:hypothetical protein